MVYQRCFSKSETCWSCGVTPWCSVGLLVLKCWCAVWRVGVGDGGALLLTWQSQSCKQTSALQSLQNVTLMINSF